MSKQKSAENMQTLRRVLTYVKPYRLHVLMNLVCAAVSAAAALLIHRGKVRKERYEKA